MALGTNGPTQTVEAYNAGDGDLALQTSSAAPWVSATVGGARQCSNREGSCLPIQVVFDTGSLARGSYTSFITLSDPNALDAPQTISVTAQVGGGVPDQLTLYVPPNGGSATTSFATNYQLSTLATTQSGGSWLSVSLEGVGSFRFVFPYRVTVRSLEGMAEGAYAGQVMIAGSNVPAENKTVPVTLNVTSQPIASPSPARAIFRAAEGGPQQQLNLFVANTGLGNLSLGGVSTATSSGATWLSAERIPDTTGVAVKVDITGLAPGSYLGSISVDTNAANGTLTIPAQVDVVAQSPPVASFGGVLNSGALDDGLAPGTVAAIFGEQLSYQPPGQAAQVPLETSLNGVRVLVNDVPAPVFYSSYSQVNFQVPYETQPGEAVVRVERDGQLGNGIAADIQGRAPRIIRSGIGEYGIVVNSDGSLALRNGGRPSMIGEVVTIYAVGFGATSPEVLTGQGSPAAEPLARITPAPRVVFGGGFMASAVADPLYIGLTPGLVGLYQLSVIIPDDAPTGDVSLSIEGDGYQSNRVLIPIQ